jgi:hypothetical protein
MSCALFRSCLLLAFAAFMPLGVIMAGGSTLAASTGPACPRGIVCDRALGVALIPPHGWQRLPAGSFPPPTLAWFVGSTRGAVNNIRLVIRSDGTTSDRVDARAATNVATRLIARYVTRMSVTRSPVEYGSAQGALIRGLPGSPGPYAFIILAHRGALYSILAPGSQLASDQSRALASLRFIPRVGPFPPANPAAPWNRGLGLSVAPVSVPGAVDGSTVAIDEPVRAIVQMGL